MKNDFDAILMLGWYLWRKKDFMEISIGHS